MSQRLICTNWHYGYFRVDWTPSSMFTQLLLEDFWFWNIWDWDTPAAVFNTISVTMPITIQSQNETHLWKRMSRRAYHSNISLALCMAFCSIKTWLSNLDFRHRNSVQIIVNDTHDDVIKWKHFPRYWPFVRGIHRSPVNSPHKGQWRGALMFTLICARINGWVNNREAGDLRRYRAHYDVIVMLLTFNRIRP